MTKCVSNTVKYFLLNLIFRLNNFLCLFLRLWKLFFIYLLVLVKRYFVNLHCYGRHHIRRFCFSYKIIKRIYIYPAVRHNICGNVFSACRLIEGNYRCVLYARISSYNLFNLRKLYSKAPYFNLSVFSADYLNIAVCKVSYNISRMIHSFIALCIIINIFRINLGGFFRLIQVTS